jgi:hypothetical protein
MHLPLQIRPFDEDARLAAIRCVSPLRKVRPVFLAAPRK